MDAMPRVLMVAPLAVPGGAARVFADLVGHAPAGGYVPIPVVLARGPLVEELEAMGSEPLVIDAGRLRDPIAGAGALRRLHRVIGARRPAVVYAHEPKGHLYTALPAAAHRRPAIWAHHAYGSRDSAVDRVAARLPGRLVLANSAEGVAALESLGGRGRVDVLTPGVDVRRLAGADAAAARRDAGIPARAPLVGIVGRLQEWKGQHVFLRAARIVADRVPEARFAVVGGAVMGWERGDYPGRLRALAGELGIADRTTFTGHTGAAADWTAALDVAVNASDREPFGLVVLEAMALGRALVAVRCGGPREIVTHGTDGLLADRPDPEQLAAHVLTLLADPALRARLGDAARSAILERHTAEATARRLGAFVRELATPYPAAR